MVALHTISPPEPLAFLSEPTRAEIRELMSLITPLEKEASQTRHRRGPIFLVRHSIQRFIYALTPQILRNSKDHHGSRALRPIAFMDGLRGYACIAVFNYHFIYAFSDMTQAAWGDERHRGVLSMPIIRLWCSGHSMVALFYCVSGYVISHRLLEMAQLGNSSERLFSSLSSSVFRRPLRMYLPVAVFTLLLSIFVHFGLYEVSRPILSNKELIPLLRERFLPQLPSIYKQLQHWAVMMSELTSVWHWKGYAPQHDPHLWTITTEFRASLVLYLSILATAKFQARARLVLFLALSLYCMLWGRWEVVLYLWGASVAQLSVMYPTEDDDIKSEDAAIALPITRNDDQFTDQETRKPSLSNTARKLISSNPKYLRKTPLLRQPLWTVLFIFSLWLWSAPQHGYDRGFGYAFLGSLTPSTYGDKKMFLPSVGITLFIWCLTRCSPSSVFRSVFTTQHAQYLGKISFAVYIVHGAVLHAIGYALPVTISQMLGSDHGLPFTIGMVVGWALSIFVVLCVADVFTREVDQRCVRFGQYLETRIVQK